MYSINCQLIPLVSNENTQKHGNLLPVLIIKKYVNALSSGWHIGIFAYAGTRKIALGYSSHSRYTQNNFTSEGFSMRFRFLFLLTGLVLLLSACSGSNLQITPADDKLTFYSSTPRVEFPEPIWNPS